MNPFTNRGMVTDPADFIGRAEQMEEICTRLHKMESTSIVGERRIGKASLLHQLALTSKERLSNSNSFRVINQTEQYGAYSNPSRRNFS